MVGKFWETVASELAKRWVALATGAATVFWTAGVAAWGVGHDDGFDAIEGFLNGLDGFSQLALALAGIGLILGSAFTIRLAQPSVLRLLQGDVATDCCLLERLRKRYADRQLKLATELGELQAKGLSSLSAPEARRAATLDRRIHRIPVTASDLRPTKLGNLMAASDARPRERFGLDPGISWPALWLVLPQLARDELQAARVSLDNAVGALVWGVLLAVWTIWTWWALAAAGVVVCLAYLALLRRAETFGELSEAAFALYRFKLYDGLSVERPDTPQADRITGSQVSELLWRGTTPPGFKWAEPTSPS